MPHIRSLIPSRKKEEGFALETRFIPEKIFFTVVDKVRSNFGFKIDREKVSSSINF
jgi:hypothetical protein